MTMGKSQTNPWASICIRVNTQMALTLTYGFDLEVMDKEKN